MCHCDEILLDSQYGCRISFRESRYARTVWWQSKDKMIHRPPTSFSYLPVSDAAMSLGFYLTGAGMDIVPPNAPYPQQHHPELYDFSWERGRTLPEFQFVYVQEGRGEFESHETERVDVSANSMMLLFPDVWHRYRPDRDTGWTEYWVSIGGEVLFNLKERGFLRPERAVLPMAKSAKVVEAYEWIIDFVSQHPDRQPASLCACALSILAEVLDESEHFDSLPTDSVVEVADDDVTRAALQTIWTQSHRKLSVSMIAKHVGVTTRTLERHFREKMGQTVLEHITQCRLDRARRMLRETKLPIKYVGYASGFSSLSHMCKVFQRELSMSPGEFRNGARNE